MPKDRKRALPVLAAKTHVVAEHRGCAARLVFTFETPEIASAFCTSMAEQIARGTIAFSLGKPDKKRLLSHIPSRATRN